MKEVWHKQSRDVGYLHNVITDLLHPPELMVSILKFAIGQMVALSPAIIPAFLENSPSYGVFS
jgi:hypothetical protein